MKEETKNLLFVAGISKLAAYLTGEIEKGNTDLEEKMLASGKTLNDCWKYIEFKAKKQAVNGCACIEDEVVYGWAVSFYEQNGEPADMEKPKKPVKPAAENADGKEEKKGKGKSKKKTKEPEAEPVKDEAEVPAVKTEIPVETADVECDQIGFADIPEVNEEPVKAEETAPVQEETVEELPDLFTEEREEPVLLPEEHSCPVCGKTMREAYPDQDLLTVRKWAQNMLDRFGHVFCSKEHMNEYLNRG